MKPIPTGAVTLVFALLATAGTAVPAGVAEPFTVRTVTMQGTSGPAYYSHTARAYRFLGPAPDDAVAALDADDLSESARVR
ncbi:hypothetical protein [Aureimonas sp. ME7]|uniref:hypothetical protein n=1 Tax=Aureimonas sp. ME7 TaxID=2744252 RepID=UPI0015F4037D|nr:hypothetical protein [Aureimonas sp. ME7]